MQIHEFPGRYSIYARSHLLTKASTVGGEKKLSRKGWRVERSRRERERKRERKRHVFFTLFLVDDVLTQKEKRKEKGIRGIRRLKGNVTVCGLHYKMAGDAERGGGDGYCGLFEGCALLRARSNVSDVPFLFFPFFLSSFRPFESPTHSTIHPFPRNASRRGDNKSLPLAWPLLLVPLVPLAYVHDGISFPS